LHLARKFHGMLGNVMPPVALSRLTKLSLEHNV